MGGQVASSVRSWWMVLVFEEISQPELILVGNAGSDDAEDFAMCEDKVDSVSHVAEASSARGIVRLQEFR